MKDEAEIILHRPPGVDQAIRAPLGQGGSRMQQRSSSTTPVLCRIGVISPGMIQDELEDGEEEAEAEENGRR